MYLPNPEIGRIIRRIRKANSLTQQALADRIGCKAGQTQISDWERGLVKPEDDYLREIAAMDGRGMEIFSSLSVVSPEVVLETSDAERAAGQGGERFRRARALFRALNAQAVRDRVPTDALIAVAREVAQAEKFDEDEEQAVLRWIRAHPGEHAQEWQNDAEQNNSGSAKN